jgi:hypothetical protein
MMKQYVFRVLCGWRGSILERQFDGTGERWWHRPVVWCLEVPLTMIECWDLRHLYHPRTWRVFSSRKDPRP